MDEGISRNGVSLSEEAHCRGPRRRAPLLGTMGYERKDLGTGISLHGGSVGQPGFDSSTGDFERWLKGAREVGHLSLSLSLSLYGSSVKGTWREGFLAGTLEDR